MAINIRAHLCTTGNGMLLLSGLQAIGVRRYLTRTPHPLKIQDPIKQEQLLTSTPATLEDNFGRSHNYLRISLTERCSLRCTYCMPAEGVRLQPKANLLTTDEIYHLTRIFTQLGVKKIRLTGGEPTVRRDIINIINYMKNDLKVEHVGITTNGLTLTRQLVAMQRAGLDSLNVSLDTMKPSRFEEVTRRQGWERVIAGIDLAIQLDYKPKINCVLMQSFNEDEICELVAFTRDRRVDLRFIEYMPFNGNRWKTDELVSFKDTLAKIRRTWPDIEELPNGPNDTSKAYRVPGFQGQIGFITSMTQHFCGTCNRLRLTADGNLKVCLFGNKEVSLRDALRSGCCEDDLVALIVAAVKRKKKQHAEYSQGVVINRYRRHSLVLQSSHGGGIITRVQYLPARSYINQRPTELTHVDGTGKATMVDVSQKTVTKRQATAQAVVQVGAHIAQLIETNTLSKGDVLTVAKIAAIMGAKKTSELIPLCHNIALTSVDVDAKLQQNDVVLVAKVRCHAKTGVEMEALTAVTVAALTVYDMCKAVSHDIVISDIKLCSKSGGKRNFLRDK